MYHLDNPIERDNKKFGNVDAAYQSLKLVPEDRHHFAEGGKLSTLDAFNLMYGTDVAAKKIRHFGPKKANKSCARNRNGCVGAVQKLAVKRPMAKKLGLTLLPQEDRLDIDETSRLFTELLLAKFRANPELCAMLLETGNKTLVEFDRGAERRSKSGDPPLFTGLVGKDGVLYGQNLMGKLLMDVREIIRLENGCV